MGLRDVEWNECPAFATHQDGAGRQHTIICDLPLHCDPQDGTAEHWSKAFDIKWTYADGAGYDDEPEVRDPE